MASHMELLFLTLTKSFRNPFIFIFIFFLPTPLKFQSSQSDLKTLQNKFLATSKLFLVTLIFLWP